MKRALTFVLCRLLAISFIVAAPSPAFAQLSFPTAASGVRAPGTVPLQCDASAANCAPPSTTNPLPVAVQAGSSIIGNVRIDQTTQGTTNGVQIRAGSALIGSVSIDQTTPGTTNAVVATGNVASGAADSGNPLKIGGRYNLALPTFADGQRGDVQIDTNGNVRALAAVIGVTGTDAVANTLGQPVLRNSNGTGSPLVTAGYVFNGTSWDRARGNVDTGALVTHTAASTGTTSADQINYNGRGLKLVIDVTAITGTSPTLTVTIQGRDTASGKYYNLLTSAALTATGTTVLEVYPGVGVTANVSASTTLPRTWRISTAIGGTTPAVTATIAASVIL